MQNTNINNNINDPLINYPYKDFFFTKGQKISQNYYTICAVQYLKCEKDIEYPIKYNEIILKMIRSLKDQYSIKTNLNSTDFSYETLSVIYDKDPIDISVLKNSDIKSKRYFKCL